MRVVLAPDSFKESMTAADAEVATAVLLRAFETLDPARLG